MQQVLSEAGPTVVADCDPRAEASALYLWLPVGAAREPEALGGAAHLLEHMLFKGAGQHGPGEAAARIERLGGDINAFTSFEQTVVHCTVPAGREAPALALLAEMLSQPHLDPAELERERDVVLEEIRGVADEASQVLGEALRAMVYPDHPYGRPVLGTEQTVRSLKREQLLAFHARHYQLRRTIFAYAGPLAPDQVAELAREHLRGPDPEPLAPLPAPAPPARARVRALDPGFDDRLVEIAFPLPGLRHPDMAAVDLLVTALGDGEASLLATELRARSALAADTWAAMEPEPLGSLAVFGLTARDGKAEAAVEALASALARVVSHGIGAEALHRARRTALSSRPYERETVDGRAHRLGWYQQYWGDLAGESAYEAALLRVGPAELAAAARRWLDPARAAVAAIAPRRALSTPRLTRAFERGFPAPASGPVVPRPRPPIERVRLACGATVILAPDPDAELVGVATVGVGGNLAERGTPGLAEVWSATVDRGAGRRDGHELAAALEMLGGRLQGWTGRNTTWLSGALPAGDVGEGLELLADLLLAPRFDPDEVGRAQAELEEARQAATDAPADLSLDLCWQLLFPGHPWGRPALGTAAGLRRSTPSRLRAWHRRVLCGNNLVIALAGAVDARAVARLDRALRALPPGQPLAHRPAVADPTFTRERRRRTPRQQAWVALGFPCAGVGDPDEPGLLLAEAALGGQSGRLFVELREKRGLAYDVGASYEEGLGGGGFTVTIGTDPARVGEAMDGLWATLEALGAAPLPTAEIDAARAQLVDGAALDLQRSSSLATRLASAERYGPGAERYRETIEAPARVSAEALQALAARVFRRDRCAVARVEPR